MPMPWFPLIAGLGLASAGAAEPTPPLASEMHSRFLALATARDAIVQGRLAEATTAIRPLAVRDATEPFPAAWRPMVIAVEAASLRVAEAPDLAAASARVPAVAVACAECHMATGGGPAVTDTDVPAQRWVAGQNMPLHRWAVDWMWLGLLADSDDAWLRGARELDNQPLAPKFEGAPPNGMQTLEQLVYVIANKALTTDAQADRAELMGALLGTCAQCHTQRDRGGR
jgi:cytochrome c553